MVTSKTGVKLIGKRIKNFRIDYQLTQKQLAEKSGVSLRSIQRFEKGEDIQMGNLIKLLNALDLGDNIEMLVPDVTERPSAFVGKTKTRKRVRISDNNQKSEGMFKWGDEE